MANAVGLVDVDAGAGAGVGGGGDVADILLNDPVRSKLILERMKRFLVNERP